MTSLGKENKRFSASPKKQVKGHMPNDTSMYMESDGVMRAFGGFLLTIITSCC